MSGVIDKKYAVELGVVPTHLKFVGGLVPDEAGRLPRSEGGTICAVENLQSLMAASPVPLDCVQVPCFPGLHAGDVEEMVAGFRKLNLEVHFILMVGGVDPMDPADEDASVAMLVEGLQLAATHGVRDVSSTSVEAWMQAGAKRKEGAEFEAAVAQNVRVHTRAVREGLTPDSSVQGWHIEFLRAGEFQTFTDMGRIWQFVAAANRELGTPFFKVLVDAAHCGNSGLTIPENAELIAEIAAADAMGIFHASAPTTRGCLSTDDGWIGALLAAAARTGKLKTAFVEVFHHEDAALEGLRQLDSGHGIDTTDSRHYDEVVVDGIRDVARRLNNLVARGIL